MNRLFIENKIIEYLKPLGVSKIGLFGSIVRGDDHTESDVDILVSFRQSIGLIQLVRMERELSEILNKKVDLLTENALKNKRLKEFIMKDLRVIYE